MAKKAVTCVVTLLCSVDSILFKSWSRESDGAPMWGQIFTLEYIDKKYFKV